MLWVVEQRVEGGVLDDLTGVHHRDTVGHLSHHAEIVGDQHDGQSAFGVERSSNRRICACTVTSNAVVGSSAMSTSGSSDKAIAIITRWRMPPENSCG